MELFVFCPTFLLPFLSQPRREGRLSRRLRGSKSPGGGPKAFPLFSPLLQLSLFLRLTKQFQFYQDVASGRPPARQ